MRAGADQAARLLKAISNPHRLMIVCALAEGELAVRELNRRIDIGQSALSQHLAVLRRQRIVSTRREAQTIYYAVVPGVAADIVQQLYTAFCVSER